MDPPPAMVSYVAEANSTAPTTTFDYSLNNFFLMHRTELSYAGQE